MQNRTAEFNKLFESFRQRRINTSSEAAARPTKREPSTFALQFNDVANRVARDISITSEQLDNLEALASKTGIYDDNPTEIEGLTDIIKKAIPEHKRQVMLLIEIKNAGQESHFKAHAEKVVEILEKKVMSAGKQFKGTLQKRTENLKKAKIRRDEFSFGVTAYNPVTEDMPTLFNALGNDHDHGSSEGDTVLDMSNGPSAQALALLQNDNYLESRASQMEAIEATMAEVSEVMKDMATVIFEQGEKVETLHENTENAANTVEGAVKTLQKTLDQVSNNRWLMMKIFGILLFFFILFVVVFA